MGDALAFVDKITRKQQSEWRRFTRGLEADGDVLMQAGLVNLGVELRLVGGKLTRVDTFELTPAGREALSRARGE